MACKTKGVKVRVATEAEVNAEAKRIASTVAGVKKPAEKAYREAEKRVEAFAKRIK